MSDMAFADHLLGMLFDEHHECNECEEDSECLMA